MVWQHGTVGENLLPSLALDAVKRGRLLPGGWTLLSLFSFFWINIYIYIYPSQSILLNRKKGTGLS